MIRKRVQDYIEEPDDDSELSEVAFDGEILKDPITPADDSDLIQPNEGMGVRLDKRDNTGFADPDLLKHKVDKKAMMRHKTKDDRTTASSDKQRIREKGIVDYPTVDELEDKNNYMFYQVFSALTDGYVNEEMESNNFS